jgi:phage baseplate assembly protein W
LERVAQPQYGAGVRQLLFESIDELTGADFKLDAATELSDNISGLSLVDMTIVQSDESQVDITVYFRTPLSSVMSTTFTLTMSELTEESAF